MMFQHAVLVNAGLVRESVFAHNSLVTRDRHTGDTGNQPRGWIEAAGLNSGGDIEEGFARLQRHHDFLERAVTGALSDSVDGALDLARARDDGCQAVRNRHPQIVMTVDRQPDAVDATHVLSQITEQLRK